MVLCKWRVCVHLVSSCRTTELFTSGYGSVMCMTQQGVCIANQHLYLEAKFCSAFWSYLAFLFGRVCILRFAPLHTHLPPPPTANTYVCYTLAQVPCTSLLRLSPSASVFGSVMTYSIAVF